MEHKHDHSPQSSAKIRNTYALPEHLLMSSWHDVQAHRATLKTIMSLCCRTTRTAEKNAILTHSTHYMDALPTFDYHRPMETLWLMIKCLYISFLLWKQEVIKKHILMHSNKGRLWIACIQARTEGIQALGMGNTLQINFWLWQDWDKWF